MDPPKPIMAPGMMLDFVKQARKDFREMMNIMKELNEGVQAMVIVMSGSVNEEKPKVEEEEEAEGIDE